jgi:hypothetical protein
MFDHGRTWEVDVTGEGHAAPAGRWPAVLWATGAVPLLAAAGHAVVLTGLGDPWVEPLASQQPGVVVGFGWVLAWATALLLPRLHTRPWQRHVIGGGILLVTAVETGSTVARAWRGSPTLSYRDQPPDVAMQQAAVLGIAAVLLVSGAVLLIATMRTRGLPVGARAGVLAGAALLYGCALALMMITTDRVDLPVGLAESLLDRAVGSSWPVGRA